MFGEKLLTEPVTHTHKHCHNGSDLAFDLYSHAHTVKIEIGSGPSGVLLDGTLCVCLQGDQ